MLATILIILGTILITPSEGVEKYNVKLDESKVTWMGSKVGGSHNGYIQIKEGDLKLEDNIIKGGSFVIDMATITNEDLTGDYKQKLEGHLKSDDFIGVKSFPNATFVIGKAVADDAGKYIIKGDITIKGITKTIEFPATVSWKNEAMIANAEIVVDRSDFDVRYGSDSFFDNLGDKVIYDDFTLNVTLVASK